MAYLVLLNNYLHDFSVALWLVGALHIHSALRLAGDPETPAPAFSRLLRRMVTWMRFSVVGILVFGIVRALAYTRYEWSDAAGPAQVKLLMAKHVAFAVLFVWGCIPYMRAVRFVRHHDNTP